MTGVDDTARRTPDEVYDDICANRRERDGAAHQEPGWHERELAWRERNAELWEELSEATIGSHSPLWAVAAATRAAIDARDSARQWQWRLADRARRAQEHADEVTR